MDVSSSSNSLNSSNSSSSGSDSSEEFFDAEEASGTLLRFSRRPDNPRDRVDLSTLSAAATDSSGSEVFFSPDLKVTTVNNSSIVILENNDNGNSRRVSYGSSSGNNTLKAESHNTSSTSITTKEEEDESCVEEEELETAEDARRRRMDEMRRRLNTEEVEEPPQEETSPSDSQTSSVEGIYPSTSRTSHPFKVVDHDATSLQSGVSIGGRLGRIISNSQTSSNASSSTTAAQILSTTTPVVPLSSSISISQVQQQQQLQQQANNSQVQQQATDNKIQQQIQATKSSASSSTSSSFLPEIQRLSTLPTTSVSSSSTAATTITTTTTATTISPVEPDLVTSCMSSNKDVKASSSSSSMVDGIGVVPEKDFPAKVPVAPPRRKRKTTVSSMSSTCGGDGSENVRPADLQIMEPRQVPSSSTSSQRQQQYRQDRSESSSSVSSLQSPPSPTVSIRSVCKDLDRTLDLGSQNNRFWVVKAQDEEKTRAKSSGPKALRRTESLPKEMMEAFDPSGTGSLGGYSSHSNSNSSTLNNSQVSSLPTTDSTVQLSNQNQNPTVTQQISSIVSAIAAAEEKKEAELNLNIMLRTRTDSGKLLSDLEILEQVTVLNLDTGERIPLSSAEDKIPQCINPLSLHIMRLTSEYSTSRKERDSDDESIDSKKSSAASQGDDGDSGVVRKKTAQIKRFIGSTVKKTVDKAVDKAKALKKHNRLSKEDSEMGGNDDVAIGGQDPLIKRANHKGPYDFDHLQQIQEMSGEHSGPVWCMKFSNCGRLLATAGQDRHIRIWVLKDHLPYFQDMRSKHTIDKVSPTPSQESIVSQHSHHSAEEMIQASENSDPRSPFVPRPLCIYSGHQADLLDIAWSKSFFLLSSSMDRTVRLWHISRRECLCCFQHIDFVTAIAFHPRDDRYFLSGSLDGKLRLWNIPDKKVALWNEVNGPNKLITTANFCQNGKFAVVGTYDGRCIFYHTEQLKYHTQIIVHRRKKMTGKKITGIEPVPGEDKILVTSNDSRIRLYDLRDLSLTCKYKGCVNSSSQIKGTISHDGKYVVSGSENQFVYIWKTNHDYSKFSSARRDRNGFWEGIKAHNAVVTCAIFTPDPDIIVKQIEAREKELEQEQQGDTQSTKNSTTVTTPTAKQPAKLVKSPTLTKTQGPSHTYAPSGYVLVSADFTGCIKVFLCKTKPKHSSLPMSAIA